MSRTPEEFCEYIQDVFGFAEDTELIEIPKRIKTFEDAGVLTRNDGLVFRMQDGSEYQVTVVQSK